MKATVEIKEECKEFWAEIVIKSSFIEQEYYSKLVTVSNKSKGQLKRKVIQFCSQLNLDYIEWI